MAHFVQHRAERRPLSKSGIGIINCSFSETHASLPSLSSHRSHVAPDQQQAVQKYTESQGKGLGALSLLSHATYECNIPLSHPTYDLYIPSSYFLNSNIPLNNLCHCAFALAGTKLSAEPYLRCSRLAVQIMLQNSLKVANSHKRRT